MSGLMPDQPVSIQLLAQQWEMVLRMLAKQPFELVAPLIGSIQQQCQMHEMRQRGNGMSMPRLAPEDQPPA